MNLVRAFLFAVLLAAGVSAPALAQSRISEMPGYARWSEISGEIGASVKTGAIVPLWAKDSTSFDYEIGGVRWRYDLTTGRTNQVAKTDVEPPAAGPAAAAAPGGLVLARGRGREADVLSPDGKLRAFSRDQNMWLAPVDGGAEKQLTSDGGVTARIRHGVGSYLYLEEFAVSQPVWWSPDGGKLAWMRYDETKVQDYFLPLDQSHAQPKILAEAYPKAGADNPIADLVVYDVATGATSTMDVRAGKSFGNDVVGHYAWAGQWTKDGSEILVRRADRLQKTIDLAACSPATGKCRSVVQESRRATWATVSPPRFLEDGQRFIWTSERNDFRNLYLYDLSGKMLAQLTKHDFDVVDIVRVDERGGWLWYTARSGDNHMLVQLHRVRLNGKDDTRLTWPKTTHRIDFSPDGKFFVDIEQAHDQPPISRLRDATGRLITTIALSDTSRFEALGLKKAEDFTFIAADGKTRLHAQMQFPSNFDPAKTYPMLVNVYGGPGSTGLQENFVMPAPLGELGFLVLKVDARTNAGQGRKVMDQSYQQLGIVEVDDIAAGIRASWARPYVDRKRVGIYGTSYGGTVAALMLMRHPDVVQAAAANSPVTDYRLYDTAYSERFLGLPATSPAAYDRAAVLTYAAQLSGALLLYYGTSDDNVHPNNALQLIKALQTAGKSFDLQVGPDRGHTSVDLTRMLEFFIEKLVMVRRDDPPVQTAG
ncbi:MAG: alpha/beta fold hydrolase [Hyphomonadaceae bacterium]